MVHRIKKKLKKFEITPYGFASTWTWEAESEEQAVKEFIAFQKKEFQWTKDEWRNFLEVSMGEADVREVD